MRGQIWSMDLALSVIIFITIVTIFFFTFNLLSADAENQNTVSTMQDILLEVTDSLVRTQGRPADWTTSTVQVIGLADQENVLNESKVLEFISLDYNASKTLLGLRSYDYYFRIEDLNTSLSFLQGQNLTKGLNYSQAVTVISVNRYVILNATIRRLAFTLWE